MLQSGSQRQKIHFVVHKKLLEEKGKSNESTRMHFNFKSNATDEVLSATLLVNGSDYSLTYNLPSGQILLENDTISIITAGDFSQVILSEGEWSDPDNENFALMLNDVL